MLQTKALTQAQATKDQVVRMMSLVCAHIADCYFSPCLIHSFIQWRPNIGSFFSLLKIECIHLATHVSWKLSAVVLSPEKFVESPCSAKRLSEGATPHEDHDETASDVASSIDLPALSEFLLTAADVLQLKTRAKLGKGKVQKKLAIYSNEELKVTKLL